MDHTWYSDSSTRPSGAPRHGLRAALAIAGASVFLLAHGDAGNWLRAGGIGRVNAGTLLSLAYFGGAGMLVWLASAVFDPWLAHRSPRFGRRLLCGEAALTGAIALLTALVYGVLFPHLMGRPVSADGLYGISYKTLVVAALVYGWLLFARASSDSQAAALELQAETDSLETSLSRTELAMLQAQIEPHFLFNTLALIKRQYRTDSAQAAQVMATLIAFLESAAPALRQDQWTLGQELALVQLYLDILAHRFGARLTHTVEAPAACHGARLPALVIATLVENAARHGLAPKAGDGSIAIRVRLLPAALQIDIADDGVGLRQHGGSGQGLATVRARLRGAFGDAATLLVEANRPCGVRAVLRVPDGAPRAA